jgi:mono/diheme cytochrome c family protein
VRDTNGAVYGVTYKWRPDNSEADLLTTSSNENFAIMTPSGVFTQTWYYPSPADCLTCHTPVANYVLGLSTRQINGGFDYPGGTTDNQLRTLNRLGLLFPAIDERNISNYYALSALTNTAASLANRARSYLDANCVQCHQPGGSGPTFDARYDTPLTNQNIIYGVLADGNLGYDNAYVVTPRDIYRSVLYDRMNSLDPLVKMPDLDRNLIDTNAVAVMAAWINSLPGTPAELPPTITPDGGVFNGSVNVTLMPPDTNATLYYTLDGTLPTTNSSLYSGPFKLTSNVTVEANAFEAGFNTSVAATAVFTVNPGPSFTGLARFTNGTFQLQLLGTVGKTNILLGSTDLSHWIPISTNVPAATPFFLADPGATNFPRRFYRAEQLP